jgi:mRNA-degrading endonuclease toxin of MazEF toxin-antitoxin module
MRNLKLLLQREPAAVGSLVASIMPVLVLLDLVRIDEAGIAAVVVAVNAAVGFGVRLVVSPASPEASAPLRAAERLAP